MYISWYLHYVWVFVIDVLYCGEAMEREWKLKGKMEAPQAGCCLDEMIKSCSHLRGTDASPFVFVPCPCDFLVFGDCEEQPWNCLSACEFDVWSDDNLLICSVLNGDDGRDRLALRRNECSNLKDHPKNRCLILDEALAQSFPRFWFHPCPWPTRRGQQPAVAWRHATDKTTRGIRKSP